MEFLTKPPFQHFSLLLFFCFDLLLALTIATYKVVSSSAAVETPNVELRVCIEGDYDVMEYRTTTRVWKKAASKLFLDSRNSFAAAFCG